MAISDDPRRDAHDKAGVLAMAHPDATIGVYPIGTDDWAVIVVRADASTITDVYKRGPLAPAMVASARWTGLIATRGHDPRRVTHYPRVANAGMDGALMLDVTGREENV